jgi:O-acetyl-ADP-ribose deacetylase (regulator of RNase III)
MENPASVIQATLGDITTLSVDAIVNAANSSLLGGGGVDGAIHRAAGPELVHECRLLGGCKTGDAKLTQGYQLPAHFIIHTVGPVWRGGQHQEAELLGQCYSNCLQLALEKNCQTIAFPCISTGIYGYPKEEAAKVTIDTCTQILQAQNAAINIIFCCFDRENFQIYQNSIFS